MIPYRDTVPLQYTPWMTWVLIVCNTIAYLYSTLLPVEEARVFQYVYGLVPARFVFPEWANRAGFPAGDYLPFITNMFMHGNALHLVFNMWLLWIFGDNVEDRMGGARYLTFYLLCGLAAGTMHIYTHPHSIVPTVGASGAIAGLMGAYFLLFPYAKIVIWVFFMPIFIEVPAIAFLGVWVLIQLYRVTTGLSSLGNETDIAWFGHLGGFIAGLLLHRLFLLRDRMLLNKEPGFFP